MKLSKRIAIIATVLTLLATTKVFAAICVHDSIYFEGTKTDTRIYSKIWNIYSNDPVERDWWMRASVKVSGVSYYGVTSLYSSNVDRARVWYGTESSSYDYWRR